MNPTTDKRKDLFRQYASPACLLVGVIIGILYTLAMMDGHHFAGRVGIAILFFSSGIMGVAYFETSAMKSRIIPFLPENLRLFYYLWFLMGVVLFISAIGAPPPVEPTLLLIIQSYIVGMIVGVAWTMSLILFIGIKSNIGGWGVVRFPVWVGMAFRHLYSMIRRK